MGKKKNTKPKKKEPVYEVESILSEKVQKGETMYLIHWRGYPVEEATWENKNNLTGAAQILKMWKASQAKLKATESSITTTTSSSSSPSSSTSKISKTSKTKAPKNKKTKKETTTEIEPEKEPETATEPRKETKTSKDKNTKKVRRSKVNEESVEKGKEEEIVQDISLPKRKPISSSFDTSNIVEKMHRELSPTRNTKKKLDTYFYETNYRSEITYKRNEKICDLQKK